MTRFFVAPTEPPPLKALTRQGDDSEEGVISLLPERHGCDVAWYVEGELWGVQRKELKDFIQSVGDGRLWKELVQMEASDLPLRLVLIEGKVQFNNDGTLIWNTRGQTITRAQWRGMLWSVRNKGAHVDFTKDSRDTAEYVEMLARWSEKKEHNSLAKRGNPRSTWGSVDNKDWGVHLLQSFEGVGVDKAEAIWNYFGGVPLAWGVTEKELCQVPGIGKTLAKRMVSAMMKGQVNA